MLDEKVTCRYIRFVARELAARVLCISEIYVFDGQDNVGLGAKPIALDVITNNPNWRLSYVNDGYSILGDPLRFYDNRRNGLKVLAAQSHPDTPIVIEATWKNDFAANRLNVYPLTGIQNRSDMNQIGLGYPRHFAVEIRGVDYAWERVFERGRLDGLPVRNPRNVAFCKPLKNQMINGVRLIAYELDRGIEREGSLLALAELEVIDQKGVNRMPDSTLSVSGGDDVQERPDLKRLVDGVSDFGPLMPQRKWLEQLELRRALTHQLSSLRGQVQVEAALREQRKIMAGWIVAVVCLTGLSLGIFVIRRARLKKVNQLRDQIANDLHDEVGSTLGSIALQTDVLSSLVEDRAQKGRLTKVAQAAREAGDTMRDLVWVVDQRSDDTASLVERLRESIESLTLDLPYRFEVEEGFANQSISPEQKRHLLLYTKEAVHNVVKHAEADSLEVQIGRDEPSKKGWLLSVTDDGKGFDFDIEDEELLDRLRSRAKKLEGDLEVSSEPGQGTSLSLRFRLG